jgi:cellulose synthase/poly-beta-1,6-N-acetylglucosamine synthase-like glycosyltransferase
METFYNVIFYIISFLSVYVQIFFLITFLEKKNTLKKAPAHLDLHTYPTVTIAVPCYNEERTIDKTVYSLLALDYPQDKLSILLVDDGSIDNTWEHIQKFDGNPQIQIFKKENGGKHTALNMALQKTTSEFFGCLDADSEVHPQALKRIMEYFQNDNRRMAVLPSIVINDPQNIIQYAQKVEYEMAIYNKKMLGFNGGIHVTPGPFSIFRKKVFDDLGPYRKAHNTEDQEIALRMQEHGYKIDHCPTAYVYTSSPNTVPKLVRQRVRWIYGFLKNMMDYKRMIFKKRYGTVALLTMPSGIITILGVMFLSFVFVWNIGKIIYHKIIQIQTVGFANSLTFHFNFDWFYINTKTVFLLIIIAYSFTFLAIFIGKRIAHQKATFAPHVIYFFLLYSIIAPFWLMKAIYNALRSREESWTLERNSL